MMKVVGEEGTNTDDFVTYLKSEFLDFVYLQQNTFDAVDAKVIGVLKADFKFDDKDQARRFFQELQLTFIDWNYIAFGSDKFKHQEEVIDAKIKERIANA